MRLNVLSIRSKSKTISLRPTAKPWTINRRLTSTAGLLQPVRKPPMRWFVCNRLQAALKMDASDKNIEAANSEITNPIVTALRQQYLELSRRESEWAARFGQNHLAVVNLRNRMQEIRQSIYEELKLSASRAKSDYEAANQRQNGLENQLAAAGKEPQSQTQAKITLTRLESTAVGYRNLYNNFLQRYMGSTQQTDFPIAQARVISPALPPLVRSKPKSILIFCIEHFCRRRTRFWAWSVA